LGDEEAFLVAGQVRVGGGRLLCLAGLAVVVLELDMPQAQRTGNDGH
jgi:hypothetical protein